eukprot:g4637.t1
MFHVLDLLLSGLFEHGFEDIFEQGGTEERRCVSLVRGLVGVLSRRSAFTAMSKLPGYKRNLVLLMWGEEDCQGKFQPIADSQQVPRVQDLIKAKLSANCALAHAVGVAGHPRALPVLRESIEKLSGPDS